MKKTVNVDDLTGSTFTVSGLDHTSAARFTPIIHPRQGAIIGVPSIQKEFVMNSNDQIASRSYINLGISFDHTYLDASQAILFR